METLVILLCEHLFGSCTVNYKEILLCVVVYIPKKCMCFGKRGSA